jgi:hypothetical protein
MEGFGFKYWTTHDPDLVFEDNDSPSNFVIFFFVSGIVFYTIGVIQYTI